jgi:hypothetical protein
MKTKDFDCVQMKNEIQENLWIEAGETFEGLIKLHDKMLRDNELYKFLIERKQGAKLKNPQVTITSS